MPFVNEAIRGRAIHNRRAFFFAEPTKDFCRLREPVIACPAPFRLNRVESVMILFVLPRYEA